MVAPARLAGTGKGLESVRYVGTAVRLMVCVMVKGKTVATVVYMLMMTPGLP